MATRNEKISLLTLVFTDLVGSTALKVEKGDQAAGALIAQHRDRVNTLASEHGGRVIDWSGDGCFLTFESSSAATFFALKLQQWHFETRSIPALRTGLHIGEVTELQRGADDVFTDVEGLSVDLSSRIQSMALPDQILMSEAVFNTVRQRVHGEDVGISIAWRAHGPYELKGYDQAIGICEVGIEDVSPLAPPENSEKALRVVLPGDEETFGWRPAVGLEVPRRERWVLEGKLGEGGYGEVWLAIHAKSKAKRVYKFCFEPDRARGLKREVVLFRLLKETLGHRDDIAQIIDWEFDEAPFFIESEYTEGGSLIDWVESKGGLDKVSLEARLELVAEVAVALGAAHSVGVLHKDIKPANILISEFPGRSDVHAVLTDFGIGLILDRQALVEQGITAAGYTDMMDASDSSTSGAGTRIYMAPEVVEAKPSTTLSDIYSLGVLLYQMIIGDLSHTIAPGWERDIEDDLLREDVALCVDGNPDRRISSAGALAERLRSLSNRREERAEAEQARALTLHAQRRRRQFRLISGVGLLLTLAVAGVALREFQRAESQSTLRLEAEGQRAVAIAALIQAEQGHYFAQIHLAAQRHSEGRLKALRLAVEDAPESQRNWEWGYLLRQAYPAFFAPPAQSTSMTKRPGETGAIWAQSRGNLLASLVGHGSEINDIAVVGNQIVTGSDDGTVRLWQMDSGELIRTFGDGQDPIFSVALNSDSDLVAAGGFSGGLYVWKLSTAEPVDMPQALKSGSIQETGSIGDIAISRDGNTLYVTSGSKIFLIDINSGEFLRLLKTEGNIVAEIALDDSANGFVSLDLGGVVEHWNAESKVPISSTAGPASTTAVSATMHLGRGRVLTGYADGEAVVWDKLSGKPIATLKGTVPQTTHISDFSPDGTAVVVPDGVRGAGLYDAESGELLSLLLAEDHVLRTAVFHPDGRHVIGGAADGTLLIWEPILDIEEPDPERLYGHTDTVYHANFSPDSRYLATASFDKTVRIWEVATGREIQVLRKHLTEVLHVQFSPDGRRLRTYDAQHITILWDADSFTEIRSVIGNPDGTRLMTPERVRGVDVMGGGALLNSLFDEGGNYFVTNTDHRLLLIDTETGETLMETKDTALRPGFQSISPDGRYVVSTNENNDLWVFDAETGERTSRLQGHEGALTMPVFSPDNRTVASASFDKTIRLWDAMDGTELHTLTGHGAFVVSVRFDKTGRRLLSSSGDGTARLWDVDSGTELVRFEGHGTMVINASFSPDFSRVLTYSWDSTAKIWDLEGRELLTFNLPEGAVYGEWSPDGRTIVLCGRNGAVHLMRALRWEDIPESHGARTNIEQGIEKWIIRTQEASR